MPSIVKILYRFESPEQFDKAQNVGNSVSVHSWKKPPKAPKLSEEEIHVWRLALRSQGQSLQSAEKLLSEDELEISRRFHFKRDTKRFMLRHASLRRILSFYLSLPPDELSFVRSEYGKPMLDPSLDTNALVFNLSHSYDVALLAIARSRRIGIDIERIMDHSYAEDILRYFFHPEEQRFFLSLGESQKRTFFFRLWTSAEAVLKAQGKTIAHGLSDASIARHIMQTIDAGWGRAMAVCLSGANGAHDSWLLKPIQAFGGYMSVCCVEGSRCEFVTYDYRGV
jgi:4'-phosphopantetheinyl transferase